MFPIIMILESKRRVERKERIQRKKSDQKFYSWISMKEWTFKIPFYASSSALFYYVGKGQRCI